MEAPPLECKLVALLAADVAGYSRLMEIDEESTLAALSEYCAVTDDLIAAHAGRVVGTAGDSILAEFASVFAAVECAVEVQEALAEANDSLPEDRRLLFRIGINVGDVMVKDGDLFGDGVTVKNVAQPIRVFRLIPKHGNPEPLRQHDSISLGSESSKEVTETVELVFWESIKGSATVADYQAYLAQYSDGAFAVLARARLDELMEGGDAMKRIGKWSCPFGTPFERQTAPHRCRPISKNIQTASSAP